MEEDVPLWVNALGNIMAFGVPSIFLGFGIWLLVKTRRFMAKAKPVSMTVVEVEESHIVEDGIERIEYLPVLEYTTVSGEKMRAQAFSTMFDRPAIGDQKTMLVNPDEPGVVRFSSLAGYGFAVFCIGIGAPALILVLIYL